MAPLVLPNHLSSLFYYSTAMPKPGHIIKERNKLSAYPFLGPCPRKKKSFVSSKGMGWETTAFPSYNPLLLGERGQSGAGFLNQEPQPAVATLIPSQSLQNVETWCLFSKPYT